MTTGIKTVARRVLVTESGEEIDLMDRPDGLGTFDDYHRKVEKYRKLYPEMFARLPSLDEYLEGRRREAARERDDR